MKELPSVVSLLDTHELSIARFIKPSIGNGLKEISTGEGNSPISMVMPIRELSLLPGMVVPVHMHERKEKIYIGKSLTPILVWVELRGRSLRFSITIGEVLVIPSNCPHFVACFSNHPCQVLVVSSSMDKSDIYWEKEANNLVAKSHKG